MNDLGRDPALDRLARSAPTEPIDQWIDAEGEDLNGMMSAAAALRDQGHGTFISFARNVFIPLTQLCRDVCHYCTFAETPSHDRAAFLSRDAVLETARAAAAAGCTEVLFTLGDKPEQRYARARQELAELGHETTISYLTEVAAMVNQETGLLPHLNPGVITGEEIRKLRKVSVSQGLMLESSSDRLCERGGPHFGSPDKHPARRLETLRLMGVNRVPTTSGILIGIGETRLERIEALTTLRELHHRYGHIQEIIVQNFKPKPRTRMADVAAPPMDELLWTIAAARLIFGPTMNIQAPPNLVARDRTRMIAAGINDWGGVSPVTHDYVNPEAPWPQLETLARETSAAGKVLVERLAVYPTYVRAGDTWIDSGIFGAALGASDATGFARDDTWFAGASGETLPGLADGNAPGLLRHRQLDNIIAKADNGGRMEIDEIAALLTARGGDADRIYRFADDLRARTSGDEVTYVINRNINYTNICTYRCAFCAFSKGKRQENLTDKPYNRSSEEVVAMAAEAVAHGATEVCLQGGIHPEYSGETYLGHARAIHQAFPELHIHAFSPLEVRHGAETMGLSIREFLIRLKEAGLRSLPGTAAEILDDEVRAIICPDKLNTDEWLEVIATAHDLAIPTTSTIMFGHVESPVNVARHLNRLRDLQARTGGFTEFVPLPFVHMEAPIALKKRARKGPTYREALLMHAVARIALYPHINNIQTSWVKMGLEGAKACLRAGCNDLGGVLMNESISRAAGASHGQEFRADEMRQLIRSLGRTPKQRLTDYRDPASR